jgi:iron(III) transport system substrate-binding protein
LRRTTPPSRLRPGPRRAALSLLLAVTALIAACSGARGPEVVLYVSADEYVARQVVAAFEAATGIRVRMVGDTEAKKTTGLVRRLRAEADHPQADVFWSSEIFMTIGLADDGVLAPFSSETTAQWPEAWRDPEGRWFAFAARARVIAYAPQRVAPDDRPRTWTDLAQRQYAGRIVMADPRFGTTGGHLGAMRATWERRAPGIYSAFLLALRDNEVRLLPGGNAAVVQAIIDGDADLGLTDTDDVWAAHAQGHAERVGLVYPAHSHEERPGNGTLLIPNTVGLVQGAPNPAAAARLIEFLLSAETERLLAQTSSHNVPLGPGADVDPRYEVPDPLAVDYRQAAAARAEAVREAMIVLAGDGEEATIDDP